jgi:hypothetical protein
VVPVDFLTGGLFEDVRQIELQRSPADLGSTRMNGCSDLRPLSGVIRYSLDDKHLPTEIDGEYSSIQRSPVTELANPKRLGARARAA